MGGVLGPDRRRKGQGEGAVCAPALRMLAMRVIGRGGDGVGGPTAAKAPLSIAKLVSDVDQSEASWSSLAPGKKQKICPAVISYFCNQQGKLKNMARQIKCSVLAGSRDGLRNGMPPRQTIHDFSVSCCAPVREG